MLKMVKIVQNDYVGHSCVLTMKTKLSRYQKYYQYLKVQCFFFPKCLSELEIIDFESWWKTGGQIWAKLYQTLCLLRSMIMLVQCWNFCKHQTLKQEWDDIHKHLSWTPLLVCGDDVSLFRTCINSNSGHLPFVLCNFHLWGCMSVAPA